MGAVISAYGQQQAGQASAAEATYQSQVAANNATIANTNANLSTAVGESQAAKQQLMTRGQVGSIKAAQGANGITIGQGSAGQVVNSAKGLGMFDVDAIRSNAARQAYGFETQSTSDTAQSQLEAAEAPMDIRAGNLAAAGTLISGAGNAASKYSSLTQSGVSPGTAGGIAALLM